LIPQKSRTILNLGTDVSLLARQSHARGAFEAHVAEVDAGRVVFYVRSLRGDARFHAVRRVRRGVRKGE